MQIKGNLVDVFNRRIYPALIEWNGNTIVRVEEINEAQESFLIPGFIDAHIHIESSMITPLEFSRVAVKHGSIGAICDPHEIANVLGVEGIDFMIDNASHSPFNFYFGLPSCVPASPFENSGAAIYAQQTAELLRRTDIYFLAEMMNFPGVLQKDPEVWAKINAAKALSKPIDGHAPGLIGNDALNYFSAGIGTDHECFSIEEARFKAELGVQILIREGSAARNFETLIPLIKEYPEQICFCSDDKHPGDLIKGHINQLVTEAVKRGYDVFDVLKAASVNVYKTYHLPCPALRVNDAAHFIRVSDLTNFSVLETWINGVNVWDGMQVNIPSMRGSSPNHFKRSSIEKSQLHADLKEENGVIECFNGQIITRALMLDKQACSLENDVVKIAVINRYQNTKPAIAYLKGTGLKSGALASSIAHDSHNIVAIGANDIDLSDAINRVIENKGCVCVAHNKNILDMQLPIAGLMSDQNAYSVAENYQSLLNYCKFELGISLDEPFMTMSFMALTVIPELKLSDKGLFHTTLGKFI